DDQQRDQRCDPAEPAPAAAAAPAAVVVAADPAGTAAGPAALLLVVALVTEAWDEPVAGFGVLVLVIAARTAEAARLLARPGVRAGLAVPVLAGVLAVLAAVTVLAALPVLAAVAALAVLVSRAEIAGTVAGRRGRTRVRRQSFG